MPTGAEGLSIQGLKALDTAPNPYRALQVRLYETNANPNTPVRGP